MNAAHPPRVERAAEWIYRGVWGALVNWMRVPDAPPDLPASGHGDAVRAFRPSPGWLRLRRFEFWFIATLVDLALLVGWVALFVEERTVALWLAAPWLVVMIVPDVIAYVMIHLRYDTTWYVLSARSVRIRRGVLVIQEKTLTFDNVQNVEVRQGPVQRFFGVSNLVIQTAGGGGGAGGHPAGAGMLGSHHGLIEGVDNAQEIRELIMSRVRAFRGAGLGDDPSEPERATGGVTLRREHLEALREIREVARAITR